jgi:uncharacterized membrane protein YecN with MAPEG domain
MFVTPLYAGILTIWFVVLSLRVTSIRHHGVRFGDNGDVEIARVIRAQANFAEYVPLALLMMGFLEASRYSIYLLHALGIVLVIARLLHGIALSFGRARGVGRFVGTALTIAVLLLEAALCLYQGLRGQWIWLQ